MKEKILTTIIASLFLISIVTALTITKSVDVTLDKDISDALINKNITKIQTYVYYEDEDKIVYKTLGDIRDKEIEIDKNICDSYENETCKSYSTKTNSEIEIELNNKIDSLLNWIGEVEKERQSRIDTSSEEVTEYNIKEIGLIGEIKK